MSATNSTAISTGTTRKKTFKLGSVIGRFSMFTNGHAHLLTEAAKECSHLLVLIGSVNRRVSNKNPFTYQQRAAMLRAWAAKHLTGVKLTILPLRDHFYIEAAWEAEVQRQVENFASAIGIPTSKTNVCLFGHDKDATTYYTKSFPQWSAREVGAGPAVNATYVRDLWFSCMQELSCKVQDVVPSTTAEFLLNWGFNDDVQADYTYYRDEEIKFKDYPHPETLTFLCGDAVVECAGHILLIKRAKAPGRNCWALPGGFKNRNENTVTTGVRELFEETNLRISERTLRKCIRGSHFFDDPARSNGIPRATYATHFKIDAEPDGSLPRANGKFVGEGGGEVIEVKWWPISEIFGMGSSLDFSPTGLVLYDDHGDIIEYFIHRGGIKQ